MNPIKYALLFTSLAVSLLGADANSLSRDEKTAGWKLLFDGTSLDGWRSKNSDAAPSSWKVDDGTLAKVAGSGDLVSKEEFGDFELSLEWKVESGTNSGVIYRASLDEPQLWHTGPEYQVLDNIAAKDRLIPSHRAGSLYDLVAPEKDVTKPVGEWNSTRIVVRGWHVEHWLNGEKTAEADLATAAGRKLIAQSKFKAYPKFATLASGHIALQDHGDPVFYRNVKIRALK